MIKCGIIGGAGYTAGELIRLLLNHPDAELTFINSSSNAGNKITDVHGGLYGETDLVFTSELPLDSIDLLFFCTAHGDTKKFMESHTVPENVKIIDLSMDYRIEGPEHDFVYGLPELNRRRICNARHIANPGCFATCIQLGVLPLAKHLMLNSDTLIVDVAGKGDFNTVQGALDFIPDFNEQQTVILVNPGDYEELVYTRNKWHVKIKGAGMADTKVHYANNEVFNPHPLTVKTNEWPGTFPSRRAAFMLDNCKDIVIEDMTIATDLKGQAEGLLINGERIALYRVHIIGSGDALQANGTIYMESCELDGGGDTILGRGSLFAYKSNFRNGGGPFSWVRNTAGNHGNVFVECTFSTEDGKQADYGRTKSNHGSAYPDAEFVLIDCKVKNIIPEGWSSIGAKTAKMYEYNTCDAPLCQLLLRHL